MAESNQEVSRIGLQFGENIDNNGKSHLKVDLNISKSNAEQQIANLKTLSKESLEYEYSVVIGIPCQNGDKQALKSELDKIFTGEITEGMIGPMIASQADKFDYQSTTDADDMVMLSLKPKEEYQGMIVEPLQMFLQNGLDQVAENQQNSISISLTSQREPSDILSSIKNGFSIASSVLESAKLVITLDINKNMPETVKNSLSEIDPSIAQSPPFFFFQYFKMLDVDLKFDSTEQLPDEIRKCLFLNKAGQKPKISLPFIYPDPVFEGLNKYLQGEARVWVTLPNFATINISANVKNLSDLFAGVLEIFSDNELDK